MKKPVAFYESKMSSALIFAFKKGHFLLKLSYHTKFKRKKCPYV